MIGVTQYPLLIDDENGIGQCRKHGMRFDRDLRR
jgi:hypothetical protein